MSAVEKLDAIEARAEAATPGPWEVEASGWSRGELDSIRSSDDVVIHQQDEQGGSSWSYDADAFFIAASRQDVPDLVAVVRAVLELHRAVEVEPSETICAGCSTLRGTGDNQRWFPYVDWPCSTVLAIEEALGGEQP